MNKKIVLSCVISLIIFGGAGFYGGMKYQQSKIKLPDGAGTFFMQNGKQTGSQGGNMMIRSGNNGGMASGEIISKDDKSITVKLRDGGTKIIFYTGSTKFEKMAEVSSSEFEIGKQVVATGTANSDGSVTAQSVQLRSDSPQVGQNSQAAPSASK